MVYRVCILAALLLSCASSQVATHVNRDTDSIPYAPTVVYDEEANQTYVMSYPLPLRMQTERAVTAVLIGAFIGRQPTIAPDQIVLFVDAGELDNPSLHLINDGGFDVEWLLQERQLGDKKFYASVMPASLARHAFQASNVHGSLGGTITFTMHESVREVTEQFLRALTPTRSASR